MKPVWGISVLQLFNRGVRNLLPSQIYSLIVTFLRGRSELINLSIDELENKIQSEMLRSQDYQTYGESLQDIRGRLLKTYEDWKDDQLDRADVASRFRQQANKAEEMLSRLAEVKAVDFRAAKRYVIGDQDPKLAELSDWLRPIFFGYQRMPRISSKAENYEAVFSGPKLGDELLNGIREDLFAWIAQYGMVYEPIWGSVISKLTNPVVIVDEVQDLSSVELDNLISLWFMLPKNIESRLVFFGDVNQQMTPSGFLWPTIVQLVNEKERIYNREIRKNLSPTDLKNNYRTTEQIARAVESMTRQVSTRFSQEIASRFLEYCINPDTTLPISLQTKILEIEESGEEDALVPRLFVGSQELFQQALVKYANQLKATDNNLEGDNQLLSTVVITQHADQLERLLAQEENLYALETNLLEIIPVMSCKGMEFDRCVLYGISIKHNSELEPDIVSNWYTSITRARMLLFIYLSEEEYEYLRWAGWKDIPKDVVFIQKPTDVDQVVNAIRSIGNTDVDAETMYGMAEISFARFLKYDNEAFLETSLGRYQEAGRLEAYRNRSATAAMNYREKGNLKKAAEYFAKTDDPVNQLECLEELRQDYLKQAFADLAKELQDEIDLIIDGIDESDKPVRALCHLILGNLDTALQITREADPALREDIADEVFRRIEAWVDKKKFAEAMWAADLLYQHNQLVTASRAFVLLDQWDKALGTAEECGELESVGKQALARVDALQRSRNKAKSKAIADFNVRPWIVPVNWDCTSDFERVFPCDRGIRSSRRFRICTKLHGERAR